VISGCDGHSTRKEDKELPQIMDKFVTPNVSKIKEELWERQRPTMKVRQPTR
jgi:hypothetical protein